MINAPNTLGKVLLFDADVIARSYMTEALSPSNVAQEKWAHL